MPSFTQSLTDALEKTASEANSRRHEVATLEHLLLTLVEEPDARKIMEACGANLSKLKQDVLSYVDNELSSLVVEAGDGASILPVSSAFQRVIQRALIHLDASGRIELTGADVLASIFSERESHAVYYLLENDIVRPDVQYYIKQGITRIAGEQTVQQKPPEPGLG